MNITQDFTKHALKAQHIIAQWQRLGKTNNDNKIAP